MASYRSELEKRGLADIPSLEELEPGRPIGVIMPLSERAQSALLDRIELLDFLVNQEEVTWS
ncbi:MAG: hypothetical protein ACE5MM_03030 [Nitrospiraceae bacterium]